MKGFAEWWPGELDELADGPDVGVDQVMGPAGGIFHSVGPGIDPE